MPNSDEKIGWGILGTGFIAAEFAEALGQSDTSRLVAVASRGAVAEDSKARFEGAKLISGYDALLADPDLHAVYIATPHPNHVRWAIRAAEAGKHVVCEKPMGVNAAEAMAAFEAARKAGTFMMEAYMYRFHPQISRLLATVQSGDIGRVRLIEATFGNLMDVDREHRLFAHELAGGAILDVGCYPLNFARLVAGAATGRPFANPTRVVGTGLLSDTGVDTMALASLEFADEILAELSTSIALDQTNTATVTGTEGRIVLTQPWTAAGPKGGNVEMAVTRKGGEERVITIEDTKPLYVHEIDAAASSIRSGQREVYHPGPSWADTIGNMQSLDAWRASIGLQYQFESPEAARPPLSGRPVVFGRTASIPQRAVPGLTQRVSSIALGTADVPDMTLDVALLDAFYEAGGNLLDTAWIYGIPRNDIGGCDRMLGYWLESRGVRKDVTIIAKGAHSPLCYPDVIPRQLTESLDKLQTDYADIYMMHRDNLDIPVGEFVDAIEEEVQAGRITSYGFSNWTLERFDEALAYAGREGKTRPTSISNNFSLAEMIEPVFEGTVSVSDAVSRDRLSRGDIAVYAWSSLARGFFTDRSHPNKRDDIDLVNSFYNEKNFERKRRAVALAERNGSSVTQVALAYCMALKEFPVLPLIGPLLLSELTDALGACDVRLSDADLRLLES